jgi:hypothetical protein
MELPEINPIEWADALIKAIAAGGWVVILLIVLFIVCKWPPWRKSK